MTMRGLSLCCSVLAFMAFAAFAVSAQQPTKPRIYGKVVDSGNKVIKKVRIWVEDEHHLTLGETQSDANGNYSVSFPTAGTIKIFYGDYENGVTSLAGNTIHQLTKVVTKTIAKAISPDQGAATEYFQYANSGSCQTQSLELGENKRR